MKYVYETPYSSYNVFVRGDTITKIIEEVKGNK